MAKVFIGGAEGSARRNELCVCSADFARLCGVKEAVQADYEAGTHEPSPALQREVQLALCCLETISSELPATRLSDPVEASRVLDDTYRGRFPGFIRDAEEWEITRKQLKEAGEAADQ